MVVGVNTGCLTKTSFSCFVVGHPISGAIQNSTQTSWYKSLVYLKLFFLNKKNRHPCCVGHAMLESFFSYQNVLPTNKTRREQLVPVPFQS